MAQLTCKMWLPIGDQCCDRQSIDGTVIDVQPFKVNWPLSQQRKGKNNNNKAVIDRRLCPRCCHLGSYFKRPKSSPVRLQEWCYCAQFIAKPKAACAPRLSWAATSSNLGFWANITLSIKPEVRNISLRRQRRTEPRQAHHNTPLPCRGRSNSNATQYRIIRCR